MNRRNVAPQIQDLAIGRFLLVGNPKQNGVTMPQSVFLAERL
jgi:hypothetical protein